MPQGKKLEGRNVAMIRKENEALLLRSIWQSGGLSRAALAASTGLTKGGVTPIVNGLLELSLIREAEALVTGSGRRPVRLELNGACCRIVSIDFTRLGLQGALLDLSGEILWREEIPFQPDTSLTEALTLLCCLTETLLSHRGGRPAVGISVVAPGPLDYEAGIILTPPNFRGWRDIPIKAELEAAFHLPVLLENDANAYAMAEFCEGLGKDFDSFIELAVNEGIGAGIFLQKQLFRGSRGLGSEAGHITLNINGPLCPCGNRGCAELYACVPSMLERVGEEIGRPVSWADAQSLWEMADPLMERELKREAFYLAGLLTTLANLFEPQAVVIAGKLALAGERILSPLRECLHERLMGRQRNQMRVLTSKLRDASLLGGAFFVTDRFLSGKLGEYGALLR